jgi:hypothetical protein
MTGGDLACTIQTADCSVTCSAGSASDSQVTAALAMSPVGDRSSGRSSSVVAEDATAAAPFYDVVLIDAYGRTQASMLRTLMLMLKQGVLSGQQPWIPVMEAWSSQPAAGVGCTTWGSAHAEAGPHPAAPAHGVPVAGTLKERLTWWHQAAAKMQGCIANASGTALFAFEVGSTVTSLANCQSMQTQAIDLWAATGIATEER